MCCGKNRTAVSQIRTSSPVSKVTKAASAFPTRQLNSSAYFEYTGKTAMTAKGPLSGRTYRFPAPGSRVEADLRDSRHLAAVPNLIRVRSL